MFSIACHKKQCTRYAMTCQGIAQTDNQYLLGSALTKSNSAEPDPTGGPPPKAQTGSMRGYRCTNFHEC